MDIPPWMRRPQGGRTFTDDDRRTLHNALEQSLGPAPAAILMAHLRPVRRAELAPRRDVVERRGELKAEVGELRAEMRALRDEIRAVTRKLIAINVVSMFACAGLVRAAVAIG